MNRTPVYFALGLLAVGCSSEPDPSAANVGGEIYRPDITEREVREFHLRDQVVAYEVVDGVAVIGGDIVMGEVEKFEAELLAAGSWHGVSKNSGIWTMPVRFKFDNNVPANVATAVRVAIAELSTETAGVLSFSECGSAGTPNCGSNPHLKFRHKVGGGCSSPMGQQVWPIVNTIDLDTFCDSNTTSEKGSIKHEIIHSMGYDHEQNRCDRDSFVTINLANVQSGKEHNFNKQCGSGWSDVISYNFGSIMHYSAKAFAIDVTQNTITTVNPANQSLIGFRGPISPGDLAMINLKYAIPTLSNGASCTANLECASGNCVASEWWVGAGKKCGAVACQPGEWDARNYGDAVCDNGCLAHVQDLCPTNMACVAGGDGTGTCVDSCTTDADCSGTHPYCVFADGLKLTKLCNKVNCAPCQYDTNPDNLACDGAFADGNSGDCGSGSTCFAAQCVTHCTSDAQCGAGTTCEYANAARTLRYCNSANCSACEYDTYPVDTTCNGDLASGTYCGSGQECNGSGQCECTLTPNGMNCDNDADCCSANCEAMNPSGTLRQCNRVSCPGAYDLDPHDLTCDNGSF